MPLPTDLPPVEVDLSPQKTCLGSPAPGRPEQFRVEKRSRESSDTSPSNNTKVARTKTPEVQSQEEQNPKHDDTGKVIEEESYCPASPAPLKAHPLFTCDSPVFSKTKTGAIKKTPFHI